MFAFLPAHLKVWAGAGGRRIEFDEVVAIASLGEHLPAISVFNNMPSLRELGTTFLPGIHRTSLPLSTETRWKGYIMIAVTGAINILRWVSWLRVPGVTSTGDAKNCVISLLQESLVSLYRNHHFEIDQVAMCLLVEGRLY